MSQFCDYKWWFVRRDDSGKITEVAVRFYEGDYQDLPDPLTQELVSTYVRSAKLTDKELPNNLKGKAGKDSAENYAHFYTAKDFGDISTDDELREFCNGELAKNESKTPITEQEVKNG